MLDIKDKFHVEEDAIHLKDFNKKRELYIKRPPYQRKNVWPISKQQKFIESIFRKYFVPRIVLRTIIPKLGVQKFDVVDGQQRLTTIKKFTEDNFELDEKVSKDIITANNGKKKFTELKPEYREHFNRYQLPIVDLEGYNDEEKQ